MLRSPGRPLTLGARSFFEPRFRHDFSRVRVHTGGRAAESARAVGARAYAVGRDIVFDRGEYAPATATGRRLLAHELAHTIQQWDASPGAAIRPDSGSREGDAERVAERVDRPGPIEVSGGSERSLARLPRSLKSSLLLSALSDDELVAEITEIRQWLRDNPAAAERQELAATLGRLSAELLQRRPALARPGDAPLALGLVSAARVAQTEAILAAAPAAAAPEALAAAPAAAAAASETAAVAAPVAAAVPEAAPVFGGAGLGAAFAGAGAFVVVLFWSNDSIVSGEEERRMLERAYPRRPPIPAPAPTVEAQPRAEPRTDAEPRVDPRTRRRRLNAYPILWATQLGFPHRTEFKRTPGERDENEAKQARMRLAWRAQRDKDFIPAHYHVHHVDPLFLGGPDDLRANGTVIPARLHIKGHQVLRYQPQMLTPPPPLAPLPEDLYKHPPGIDYELVGFKREAKEP